MATATLDEPEVHSESEAQYAPRWRVLLHYNEHTTCNFVVYLLQEVFKIDHDDAVRFWSDAIDEDVATVAVLPRETAELKHDQARSIAKTAKLESPLSIEPE